MRAWNLLSAVTLICCLAAFSACSVNLGSSDDSDANDAAAGEADADSTAEEEKEEAVPVEVDTIARGPIESVLEATAHLEAEDSVQVFSQTAGLITTLNVEEGHRVRKGALLIKLEDHEQLNEVARVKSQLDKARREYERQERLFEQKLISEQAFNESTHEIEQLEISLTDAETQLRYTEVRAPISGTVTARLVNLGDRVQPGQQLFDIVDFNSLVARIFVPEKELPRLKKGLAARITSQARPGTEYQGRLQRIAPVVDARSGTVKATVAVGGQRGLLPGMYVEVELITDVHSDAVLIPKRALAYDSDRIYVYRVDEEGRAQRLLVDPVLENEQYVESPPDLIAAGDQIVVAGQAALKNGALVRRIGIDPIEDDSETATEVAASVEG